MKFNELCQGVYSARRKAVKRLTYSPEQIVVYMTRDFYMEGMAECSGAVSQTILNICQHGSVLGHDIYLVEERAINPNSNKHPPFRVVDLGAGK